MSQHSPWTVDAERACLSTAALGAALDLLDPVRGLHDVRWRGQSLPAVRALLGLSFETRTPLNPELLLDAYARQGDLVVSYAQSPRRDVAVQAYWRTSEQPSDGAAVPLLDVQASVQTDLLDSVPSIYTYNVAMVREVWQPRDEQARDWRCTWQVGQPSFILDTDSRPGCLVLRLAGASPPASGSARSSTPVGMSAANLVESVSLILMVQPGELRSGRAIIDPAEPQRVAIVCNLFHEHLEKGVIRRVWQRIALVDSARDLDVAGELYRSFATAEPSLTV